MHWSGNKLSIILVGLIAFIAGSAYRSGAPVKSTCAPAETHCSTNGLCHGGAVNTGAGVAEIAVMSSSTTCYSPGKTYTLMPYLVSNDGKTILGFQTVAKFLNASAAGTVSITDPLKTQKVVDNNYEYVTHTSAGASNPGLHDWMYNWKAPVAGSGTVIIYGAFLAANGDNTSTGDLIYTDSLVLNECGVGVEENLSNQFILFPNPVSSTLTLQFKLAYEIIISIYNCSGEKILNFRMTQQSISIPLEGYAAGNYFLKIETDDGKVVKRFCKL